MTLETPAFVEKNGRQVKNILTCLPERFTSRMASSGRSSHMRRVSRSTLIGDCIHRIIEGTAFTGAGSRGICYVTHNEMPFAAPSMTGELWRSSSSSKI